MKNKFLDHFDLWLKLLLRHFSKHKIQGRIFFVAIGLAIIVWSFILAFYIGKALFFCIVNLTNFYK